VNDVSRSQSPYRLGWATAPSELMSLHSTSVSSTSTTSTRRFVGGLASLIEKEVDVGLTATSSEHQQSELARARAMYDNNRRVGSTFISAEVDRHHQDVIASTRWRTSPAILVIDSCTAGMAVKSRQL